MTIVISADNHTTAAYVVIEIMLSHTYRGLDHTSMTGCFIGTSPAFALKLIAQQTRGVDYNVK